MKPLLIKICEAIPKQHKTKPYLQCLRPFTNVTTHPIFTAIELRNMERTILATFTAQKRNHWCAYTVIVYKCVELDFCLVCKI